MPSRRAVELVAARMLSPSVRELELRCVDGQPLEFEAGQWADLHVETPAGPDKRAYSIASGPSECGEGRLLLAVTRVESGAVSNVIHGLPIGARLQIDGPHGFFTRADTRDQPALLVGTGTGLCPLRSMLVDALADGADGPPLTLLFGCRSETDILWREDLERWSSEQSRLTVHVTLSRPPAGWSGRSGYVQTHLAELAAGDPRPHVYVCGLSEMVSEVRQVLKSELGYDRRQIHSERYD